MARRIQTNFSKGEGSPLLEGRPDLASFFECGRVIENFNVMRQGGLDRRNGLRFVKEVKDSNADTIILPFETSVNDAYIIELGNGYGRFYKNKSRIDLAGSPIEVSSPYPTAILRNIHFTQSVDVMFLFEPTTPQQKLAHITDNLWTMLATTFFPPPSTEVDTDISLGGTLTPSATSGDAITFTATVACFLQGDVGRQIIFGTSYAIIVSVGATPNLAPPQLTCKADIVNAFPDVNPIVTGAWKLRLGPQTTLDPNVRKPIGGQVKMLAGKPSFRAADLGKFIFIYGGLIEITKVTNSTNLVGIIRSELADTTIDDPKPAPAGAWQMQVVSWSAANGYPRTGEFYSGRLLQAGTFLQPVNFWLSQSDDFDKYAVGATADRALDYAMAARGLNRIEWAADNIDLFIGTGGTEHRIRSGDQNKPLGGDSIPLVERITNHGVAPIQPTVIARHTLFVDRSRRLIFFLSFDFAEDGYDAVEITGISEHITKSGIRLGPSGFAKRPDPRVHYIREDGQAITLTYYKAEKVVGFTRYVTDGTFEAVAVIPQVSGPDQVWFVVKRVINGVTKRYIEVGDDNASEVAGRAWTNLQTDCAKIYQLFGVPTTVFGGLGHLEGKMVDVIGDGVFRGQKQVIGAQVTITEPASIHCEIGLHYDSTATTMRPAIEKQVVEGLPRTWAKAWVRVKDTYGGRMKSTSCDYQDLVPRYPVQALNQIALYSGDIECNFDGTDTDGAITVQQNLPYPMTILSIFGEVDFGPHG